MLNKAQGKDTGKPDAGNPPVRFDEGGGVDAPLYSTQKDIVLLVSLFLPREAFPANEASRHKFSACIGHSSDVN